MTHDRLIGRYEVVAFWLIEDGVCCLQKSIKAAMDAPEILPSDFAKFERPAQLHIAFLALSHYRKKHGALPKPRCQVSLDHRPSQDVCGLFFFLCFFKFENCRNLVVSGAILVSLWCCESVWHVWQLGTLRCKPTFFWSSSVKSELIQMYPEDWILKHLPIF